MFDDQPTTGGTTPPPNLPVEPEDIFAETEVAADATPAAPKALGAGLLKAKTPATAVVMPKVEEASPMAFPDTNYNTKSPIIGKVVIGVAGLAVLSGMAFGGWWLYGKFFSGGIAITKNNTAANVPVTITEPVQTTVTNPTTQTNTVVQETTNTAVVEAANTSSTVAQMQSDQLLFGERKDTDGDGLDDATEVRLGTDPKKADTDGDKLCDGDEVLIWKTNPLKADTDSDGHPDGTEVYNGYNPNGSGKLGPLPAGFTTSTACQSAKK